MGLFGLIFQTLFASLNCLQKSKLYKKKKDSVSLEKRISPTSSGFQWIPCIFWGFSCSICSLSKKGNEKKGDGFFSKRGEMGGGRWGPPKTVFVMSARRPLDAVCLVRTRACRRLFTDRGNWVWGIEMELDGSESDLLERNRKWFILVRFRFFLKSSFSKRR